MKVELRLNYANYLKKVVKTQSITKMSYLECYVIIKGRPTVLARCSMQGLSPAVREVGAKVCP